MTLKDNIENLRKEHIIEATIRAISRQGMHNVTLEDIAREAGLSKGGIAHYFSSKDELFTMAFREFFAIIFKRSRETMDMYSNPLDKVLSFSWLYNWNDPDVNLGYPLLFSCILMAVHNNEYRKIFHEWVNNWISLLSEALELGVREGDFIVEDIESTARAISSVYNGLATRWYLDGKSHSTEWAVASFKKIITCLVRFQD